MSIEKVDHRETNTPTWEKILGLFGLVLLCAGFIYLGWSAITEKNTPPDIVFEVKEISPVEQGFLAQVDVLNKGSQTAAVLLIVGSLASDTGDTETSTAQIDYLPSNSKARIGLYFSKDPNLGTLTFRPLGYREP